MDPMGIAGIGIYQTHPIPPFQLFPLSISWGDTESEAQRAELLEAGKRNLKKIWYKIFSY